jgi:hypothetical protein
MTTLEVVIIIFGAGMAAAASISFYMSKQNIKVDIDKHLKSILSPEQMESGEIKQLLFKKKVTLVEWEKMKAELINSTKENENRNPKETIVNWPTKQYKENTIVQPVTVQSKKEVKRPKKAASTSNWPTVQYEGNTIQPITFQPKKTVKHRIKATSTSPKVRADSLRSHK